MENRVEEILIIKNDVDNLKNYIDKMIILIRNQSEYNGVVMISSVSEALEYLINYFVLNIKGGKSYIEQCNINDEFQEIILALENEDYFLIADLFEYEIVPFIDEIFIRLKSNGK